MNLNTFTQQLSMKFDKKKKKKLALSVQLKVVKLVYIADILSNRPKNVYSVMEKYFSTLW